jgi:hypothetical protein
MMMGRRMDHPKSMATLGVRLAKWLCVPVLVLATGCHSSLSRHAQEAEADGKTINNDAMTAMYPQSFRPGSPPYLERDFEAGADFICDEIKLKYDRDICSESKIGWR